MLLHYVLLYYANTTSYAQSELLLQVPTTTEGECPEGLLRRHLSTKGQDTSGIIHYFHSIWRDIFGRLPAVLVTTIDQNWNGLIPGITIQCSH